MFLDLIWEIFIYAIHVIHPIILKFEINFNKFYDQHANTMELKYEKKK